MSRHIIKADEDLYMVWSSIVDAPVIIGTKDEINAELLEDLTKEAKATIQEMHRRAQLEPSEGEIYSEGWLPAKNFAKLARRLLENVEDCNVDCSDLLEPFDNDDQRG